MEFIMKCAQKLINMQLYFLMKLMKKKKNLLPWLLFLLIICGLKILELNILNSKCIKIIYCVKFFFLNLFIIILYL